MPKFVSLMYFSDALSSPSGLSPVLKRRRELNLRCGRSPLGVLDLLSDEVEGVPAGVGEEGGVQGQSNGPRVLRRALKHVLKVLSLT